jgi:DNA-binding Lrp family transcriptional regulator
MEGVRPTVSDSSRTSPLQTPDVLPDSLFRHRVVIIWYNQGKSCIGGFFMVTALVLLTVARDKVNVVAETLADMEGITEVYSVAGRYDLAVIIRVKDNDQLAELVTNHMLKVEGILTSETLVAFRVHSRHDLESMFSIGL